MNAPLGPLFRQEAVAAKHHRIDGEIILSQPVRTQTLILLIFGLIVGIGIWLVLGTYSRSEMARGILVTDVPSAKIVAIRPGRITELLVREGDVVRAGQRLATIRTEQSDERGDSVIGASLAAIDTQRQLAEQQGSLAGRRGASGQMPSGRTASILS